MRGSCEDLARVLQGCCQGLDSQEQLFKSFGGHPPQVLLSSGLGPPKTSFCNVSKAAQELVLKVSAAPPKNRKSEVIFFCLIRLLKLIDSSPLAALSRPDGFCPFRTENRGGSQKLILKVLGPGGSQEQLFEGFGEQPAQVLQSSGLWPPQTSFCNVSKAAQELV